MGCWWYRTITLLRETEFALATRADAPSSGYAGDFIETPIRPDRVYNRHDGHRLVALKITVTDMSAVAADGRSFR